MNTIKTVKQGNRNHYIRVVTDEMNRVVLNRECDLDVIMTINNGQTVFSLLDGEGQTNSLFNKYINERMVEDHRSINTRKKAADVLRKFYSFIELMGYSEYALGIDELYQLRSFFQDSGPSQTSNRTVNMYLGIIRTYFAEMDIPCAALSSRREISQQIYQEGDFRVEDIHYIYDVNLPENPHVQERVPKYISLDEYIRVQEIAKAEGDLQGVILTHLFYRYGMRPGEALGLTTEDLVTCRIKDVDVPTLIVRNRVSDEPWQHAKRKLIPKSKKDYESLTYIRQWRDDDYAHYYLTESGEFVEVLRKFIRETSEQAERNNAKNYRSCEADIVYPADFAKTGLEKNHYIFVNRLGKRLSAQLWGKRLKKYFIKAGIRVDQGKRDKNLSHRFRHGFAMMHARFMDPPVPPHELQKMMHHKNLSYTMVYYNPTAEDEYDYKTKMQNKFFDNNPRLNDIIDSFLK